MPDKQQEHSETISEIIFYQTEDGRNRVEVGLEHETVWLEAMER